MTCLGAVLEFTFEASRSRAPLLALMHGNCGSHISDQELFMICSPVNIVAVSWVIVSLMDKQV